jgi:ketosteroid isomerase-like protein
MVALALALGACGGDSDEDQVSEAIENSYSAFAEGDAEAFCDTLSPDYLADFEDYYEGCDSRVLDGVREQAPSPEEDILEAPEITDVQIDGETASATVNGESLELVRVEGEWKLDDFDVPGGE